MSPCTSVWIITDAAGFVLSCSAAALELLGYSARGARGRQLPNMFVGNRPRLSELLFVAQGGEIERAAQFRPNDRKAIPVRFRVTAAECQPGAPVELTWTFDLRWPVGMRLPRGVDRRQLITVWRQQPLRCIFVPGGADRRRLLVCGEHDEVLHEEPAADAAAAFTRARELQKLATEGHW
jgi:PAS domain-containing protein